MFEDSLFDSSALPKTRRVRLAAGFAAGFQGVCLGMVLLVPLLHPAVLPVVTASSRVELVPRVRPMVQPVAVRRAEMRTASNSYAAPAGSAASAPAMVPLGGPRMIAVGGGDDSPAPAVEGGLLRMGDGGGGGGPLAELAGPIGGASVAPRAVPAGPTKISSGVSAGLLLGPITPAYPAIARAAHVEGIVMLRATIDRDGRIKDLRVVSGPEMLRRAALEAVAAARYRPYLLNGEATEVETSVSITFRMMG